MKLAPSSGSRFTRLALLSALATGIACGPPASGDGAPPTAGRGMAAGSGGQTAGGGAGGSAGSADAPVAGADATDTSAGDATLPARATVALPLVVTEHFDNRGWFGDATIVPHFKPGLIVETPGAGLCASRPAGAVGRCMQIKYLPPPGFQGPPPRSAFVGAFMLTTLRTSHGPDANTRAGMPNWGLEPGLEVAAGAKRVAFFAAAETPGAKVDFHVGLKTKDSAITPARPVELSAGWTRFEIPLAGTKTGASLWGGFGWTYKQTSEPITFYLDGIVWDAEGEELPVPPPGAMDGRRDLVFINRCTEPVWVGFDSQQAKPEGGGFRLDAGATRTFVIPAGEWQGRWWGRTGCSFDAAGAGTCETGACEGGLRCVASTRAVTLGEIFWPADPTKLTFYDISLVDGFNLPMAIAPLPGSHGQNFDSWDCGTASCMTDVNARCPAELRKTNAAGKTVACLSACEKTGAPQFCCTGAHSEPETCPSFETSRLFKSFCPTAYSYAYDDQLSTFTCKGEDFAVWFCPQPGKR